MKGDLQPLHRLFLLRPDIVFLNHGSFGACPRPVFEAYQAWQLELERQPVEFLGRRFQDLMRQAREVLREARQKLEELTGLPGICPDSPEWYAQMAAFPLPACDGEALQRRLWDSFRVEVPVISWNGRQFVRVSIQGYNTDQDVAALVRALAELSPSVHPEKA